ncbi:MAG: phosphatase PAP2 family protein [archaeon]
MVFEEIIVNQFLQSYATPLLTEAFKAITYFGNPAVWVIIAAWLFWIGKERKSFVVMSIMLFCGVIAGGLKILIARPRPTEVIALVIETSPAFPSAHSTLMAAYAIYGWLSKWVQKYLKYLLIILTILVGISRLYLGVHYLSDVLAGLLIGGIIGRIVIKLESKIDKINFHISKIQDEFLAIIFFILMLILYFFVPEQYHAGFTILGYFAGYSIYRHTKINLDLKKSKSLKLTIISIIIGTGLLGAMGYIALKNPNIYGDTLFFIAGIFMTVIWPLVIQKFIQKK